MNIKKLMGHPDIKITILLYDMLAIIVAWLGAFGLYYHLIMLPSEVFLNYRNTLPYVLISQIITYHWFGVHRGIWCFTSIADLTRIIKAGIWGVIFSAIGFYFNAVTGIPRAIFILDVLLIIALWIGARLAYRLWHEAQESSVCVEQQRVLLVGAGQAGEGIAREMRRDSSQKYKLIAFVDDSLSKQGQEIHRIRVVGRTKDIPELVKNLHIDLIIIAIPSARSAIMRHIVEQCEKAEVPVRTLPGLPDLVSGRVSVNALREVMLEDLLGREQVELDWHKIGAELQGHSALVTGGGGSIGAELCRQIAQVRPASLIIVENSEFNLYSLEQELEEKFPQLKLFFYLADVTDQVAMAAIMDKHRPELVFHAAAYKHVPMLENQLRVAMKNNIIGTRVMAEEAARIKAKKFVLISTDKAVNPSNIMGATKRAAEVFCQNYDAHTSTQFITVRFGNVLGSAGSVVPLFTEQLKKGGPLTVTHPEITRYFMTIPEASQLILQATTMGQGAEIFVLDMGEPIKISYLAEQIIQLAGKRPGTDIEIVYTGLRPGEKLFEELFHASEELVHTEHEKILKARYRKISWQELTLILDEVVAACANYNETQLLSLLKQLVPEYQMMVITTEINNSVTSLSPRGLTAESSIDRTGSRGQAAG